jgi:hypothetical protein
MDVEDRATTAGYRLAQRSLNGQVVWWWQLVADPDDTRQPCWLERRQALSYMEGVLQRSIVTPAKTWVQKCRSGALTLFIFVTFGACVRAASSRTRSRWKISPPAEPGGACRMSESREEIPELRRDLRDAG